MSIARYRKGLFQVINRIKEKRLELGISRRELSERSGVHYNKISDYENGYYKIENITLGTLVKIADALDVTLDELCRDKTSE